MESEFKCTKCGYSGVEQFNFCPECGQKVVKDNQSLNKELLEFLQKKNLYGAIRCYRENTGKGLKESSDYINELAVKHNIILENSPVAKLIAKLSCSLILSAMIIPVIVNFFPIVAQVAGPIVCRGEFAVVSADYSFHAYCADVAGLKEEISLYAGFISVVIYSVLIFVLFMLLSLVFKSKKYPGGPPY